MIRVSHSHAPGAELELAPAETRRVRAVLAALVAPLLVATIAGLVLLWPSGDSPVG